MVGEALLLLLASSTVLSHAMPLEHQARRDSMSVNHGGRLHREADQHSLMRRMDSTMERVSSSRPSASLLQEYDEENEEEDSDEEEQEDSDEEVQSVVDDDEGEFGDANEIYHPSESDTSGATSLSQGEKREMDEKLAEEIKRHAPAPATSLSQGEIREMEVEEVRRHASHRSHEMSEAEVQRKAALGTLSWVENHFAADSQEGKLQKALAWTHSKYEHKLLLDNQKRRIEEDRVEQNRVHAWMMSNSAECGSKSTNQCSDASENCEWDDTGSGYCFGKLCGEFDKSGCESSDVCFWDGKTEKCYNRDCTTLTSTGETACKSNKLCHWLNSECRPKPCSEFDGWTVSDSSDDEGGEDPYCGAHQLCEGQAATDDPAQDAECKATACEGYSEAQCSENKELGCKWGDHLCKSCDRLSSSECEADSDVKCKLHSDNSRCRAKCADFTSQENCESKIHQGCQWATKSSKSSKLLDGDVEVDPDTEGDEKCVSVCMDESKCKDKTRQDCVTDKDLKDDCPLLCGLCPFLCDINAQSYCDDKTGSCEWIGSQEDGECEVACETFAESDCTSASYCTWNSDESSCKASEDSSSSMSSLLRMNVTAVRHPSLKRPNGWMHKFEEDGGPPPWIRSQNAKGIAKGITKEMQNAEFEDDERRREYEDQTVEDVEKAEKQYLQERHNVSHSGASKAEESVNSSKISETKKVQESKPKIEMAQASGPKAEKARESGSKTKKHQESGGSPTMENEHATQAAQAAHSAASAAVTAEAGAVSIGGTAAKVADIAAGIAADIATGAILSEAETSTKSGSKTGNVHQSGSKTGIAAVQVSQKPTSKTATKDKNATTGNSTSKKDKDKESGSKAGKAQESDKEKGEKGRKKEKEKLKKGEIHAPKSKAQRDEEADSKADHARVADEGQAKEKEKAATKDTREKKKSKEKAKVDEEKNAKDDLKNANKDKDWLRKKTKEVELKKSNAREKAQQKEKEKEKEKSRDSSDHRGDASSLISANQTGRKSPNLIQHIVDDQMQKHSKRPGQDIGNAPRGHPIGPDDPPRPEARKRSESESSTSDSSSGSQSAKGAKKHGAESKTQVPHKSDSAMKTAKGHESISKTKKVQESESKAGKAQATGSKAQKARLSGPKAETARESGSGTKTEKAHQSESKGKAEKAHKSGSETKVAEGHQPGSQTKTEKAHQSESEGKSEKAHESGAETKKSQHSGLKTKTAKKSVSKAVDAKKSGSQTGKVQATGSKAEKAQISGAKAARAHESGSDTKAKKAHESGSETKVAEGHQPGSETKAEKAHESIEVKKSQEPGSKTQTAKKSGSKVVTPWEFGSKTGEGKRSVSKTQVAHASQATSPNVKTPTKENMKASALSLPGLDNVVHNSGTSLIAGRQIRTPSLPNPDHPTN